MGTRIVLAAAAIATLMASSAAHAADEIVKFRQALMENNVNAVTLAYMLSVGRVMPFDATIARNALMAIASDNEVFPTPFPDNTKTGPTFALPALFANKAAFTALSLKMVADARAAAADATSAAALNASAAFLEVQKNCTTCHTQFRAPH